MNTLGVEVKQHSSDGINIVTVAGEVNVLNIDGFKRTMADVLGRSGDIVVDLRKVSYIDSAGLEQLIIALSRQNKRGSSLGILVLKDSQPDDVLHIVQLHTLTMVTSDPREVGLEG